MATGAACVHGPGEPPGGHVGVAEGVPVGVGDAQPPPAGRKSYSVGFWVVLAVTTTCAPPGRPVYERWLAEVPGIGLGIPVIIGLDGSTTGSLGLKSQSFPWPPKGMGTMSPQP